MPQCCESILGLKAEAVKGKQVSLEWTETSGELWEWWHDPGVPLAFPVESTSSSGVTGTRGILSRPRRERIPPLELEGGNGNPLDVAGVSYFLSSGDGYVGELLECSKGVKDPLEVPEVRCD